MKWLRNNLIWAFQGVTYVFRTQVSARLQLAAAVVVLIAGFGFGIDRWEWVAVILSIGLVFAAETLNTALEALADAVHPDRHPLVGRAKDAAAGAVLLAAIAAAVVGSIVFLPRILPWLKL